MRVAKFCERNIKVTKANIVLDILQQNYQQDIEICVVDCFRRCLECRVTPFCRVQLTTLQDNDVDTLVKKILENV